MNKNLDIWHYRVFKTWDKFHKHCWYSLKEVYPGFTGKGEFLACDDSEPGGETRKELIQDLENMLADAKKYKTRTIEEV